MTTSIHLRIVTERMKYIITHNFIIINKKFMRNYTLITKWLKTIIYVAKGFGDDHKATKMHEFICNEYKKMTFLQ